MIHADRHPVFVLPEPRSPTRRGLRLLILPDGNTRAGAPGGRYSAGAANVIAVARHLARSSEGGALVACILSRDNVEKRSDAFFGKLRDEFLELGEKIDESGILLDEGIRIELAGQLDGLRARGGNAAALAGAISAIAAKTARIVSPRFGLFFGVGYGDELLTELDVDIVMRTGMEEPGVLRLSGLRARPATVHVAVARLWPEITVGEVDAVIEAATARLPRVLRSGYDACAITGMIGALAASDLTHPVSCGVPACVPEATLVTAIERLFAGSRLVRGLVLVELVSPEGSSRRFGQGESIRHELRILRGAAAASSSYLSFLAPGQDEVAIALPETPLVGYANVHVCAPGPEGIVGGLRAALTFGERYPPLLGAERRAA